MNTQVPATTRGDATGPDASKLTTTKPSAPAWKAIAPIAVALVLALLPAPSGLPHHAWYFFSIFVGVIVGLVLEVWVHPQDRT
jgi:di/tricarboxylate transporter